MHRYVFLVLMMGLESLSLPCSANQVSSMLVIKVNLSGRSEINANSTCTSQTLSEQTNATVRIVCATGQFVSISPLPGRQFLGTHGGAFRYNFRGNSHSPGLNRSADGFFPGAGTVTGMRVYSAGDSDGLLELLVSF